jgi:CRISPR-associated protein Cmr4
MYERRYGLIRTLAPLHVGASEGEEAGNLNLIFRDPFTQTGMIPGSSIRGRFRAECRASGSDTSLCEAWYGNNFNERKKNDQEEEKPIIKEGAVKFEYASLVWLPVFCPGQPIVWVSCPRLLRRYAACARPGLKGQALEKALPKSNTCSKLMKNRSSDKKCTLFFNLGFMELDCVSDLEHWIPSLLRGEIPPDRLVVVDDADMGMIHDMALFRQSRVKLNDDMKKAQDGAFFNVEAIPEASVLVFPLAIKPEQAKTWKPFGDEDNQELYFGGLESVGFGRCFVMLMPTQQEWQK